MGPSPLRASRMVLCLVPLLWASSWDRELTATLHREQYSSFLALSSSDSAEQGAGEGVARGPGAAASGWGEGDEEEEEESEDEEEEAGSREEDGGGRGEAGGRGRSEAGGVELEKAPAANGIPFICGRGGASSGLPGSGSELAGGWGPVGEGEAVDRGGGGLSPSWGRVFEVSMPFTLRAWRLPL